MTNFISVTRWNAQEGEGDYLVAVEHTAYVSHGANGHTRVHLAVASGGGQSQSNMGPQF